MSGDRKSKQKERREKLKQVIQEIKNWKGNTKLGDKLQNAMGLAASLVPGADGIVNQVTSMIRNRDPLDIVQSKLNDIVTAANREIALIDEDLNMGYSGIERTLATKGIIDRTTEHNRRKRDDLIKRRADLTSKIDQAYNVADTHRTKYTMLGASSPESALETLNTIERGITK